MKNSAIYHTLPTIRKIRRVFRRSSKKANEEFLDCGGKATIKCYDQNGANVLKTRRWRNRFMTNDIRRLYETYLQQS